MVIIMALIFGLVFGSFLNVLVFRTHADVPLTGRSKCLKCEEPISWFDLVPVLSYFLLRGRCRRCQQEISWQYPAVEAATAILFALITYVTFPLATGHLPFPLTIRDAIFTIFLIIIFVYDLKYSYILDRFTLPGMIIAVLLNLALGVVSVPSMVGGGLIIGWFFLAQYVVSKGKWVGGGDVRMGLLMGLMIGLAHGLLALFIAYAVGAVIGIGLILVKRKGFGSAVPFGTFLSFGTFVAMLWGGQILDWYLGYFR